MSRARSPSGRGPGIPTRGDEPGGDRARAQARSWPSAQRRRPLPMPSKQHPCDVPSRVLKCAARECPGLPGPLDPAGATNFAMLSAARRHGLVRGDHRARRPHRVVGQETHAGASGAGRRGARLGSRAVGRCRKLPGAAQERDLGSDHLCGTAPVQAISGRS